MEKDHPTKCHKSKPPIAYAVKVWHRVSGREYLIKHHSGYDRITVLLILYGFGMLSN